MNWIYTEDKLPEAGDETLYHVALVNKAGTKTKVSDAYRRGFQIRNDTGHFWKVYAYTPVEAEITAPPLRRNMNT